jgi:hypothetical protein
VEIPPPDDWNDFSTESFPEPPKPEPVEEFNLIPNLPETYEATPAEPEIAPTLPVVPKAQNPSPVTARFYLQLYAFQQYERVGCISNCRSR